MTVLSVAASCAAAPDASAQAELECGGALHQGGLAVCRTTPGAQIEAGGVPVAVADPNGAAMFGLKRDAPEKLHVAAGAASTVLTVTRRRDDESVIAGAACDKLDARTPEQKAAAAASWVVKQDAWDRIHAGRGALDGFVRPAAGRTSSPFGFTRRYVTQGCPEKVSPHLGYDIAGPVGADIVAPAGGTVILAERDLYYEGGTVFLDHGHGLVSIFLHMSALDVALGDTVEAGEKLGEIGATGRVTGPHLHWGVKWRNLVRGDRDGDFYIDPALLLELPRPSAAKRAAAVQPAAAGVD